LEGPPVGWDEGRGRGRRGRRGRKGQGEGEGEEGEVGGEVDQLPMPPAEEAGRVTAAAAAVVELLPPPAVVPASVDKEAEPEREYPGGHRTIFGDPRARNSTRTNR
jgi:hypothetical protein